MIIAVIIILHLVSTKYGAKICNPINLWNHLSWFIFIQGFNQIESYKIPAINFLCSKIPDATRISDVVEHTDIELIWFEGWNWN